MHRLARLWFAASLGILLFTSGCFRPGGAALESTNAAFGAPTFTIQPTDIPASTLVVQTVVVTQLAQLPTETVDPVAQAETQLAQVPTSTPDPFAISTTPPDPFALLTGTAIADAALPGQFQQDQDPFAATLTAQAGGVIFPTQDPALFGEPLDPPFQTATAVIVQATLNVAIEWTQTAAALFGPTPTPPPLFPTETPLGGAGGFEPTTPPQVLPGQNCIYVVQAGDNLFRIGLRFGVAYQQIAAANGILNPNLIYPGQQLAIPGVATNCTPIPYTPYPVTPPPGGGGRIHVVMQNETLFQLSRMYGPTVHQIAAANGIVNINLIYIGQQLVIP